MVIRRKSKVKHTAKKTATKKRQPKRVAKGVTAAPCLKKLLADATARWPRRSRLSDGILPSEQHSQQNPTSDHERGNAGDLTHDPVNGPDINAWLYQLTADARVKYAIFNRRIWRPNGLGWRPYTGRNPHDKHLHVSIYAKSRDDLRPWPWTVANTHPTLKRGDRGQAVSELQQKLVARGYKLTVDGSFGPKVEAAVRDFQEGKGLVADGIVGRATWAALDQQA